VLSKSFDPIVTAIDNRVYSFSSIENGEYSKLYDYLKSQNIKVTTEKIDSSSLTWVQVPGGKVTSGRRRQIKQYADDKSYGDNNMSSDDEDFDPDSLEALSAKEEYDSEPSNTSSEDEISSEDFSDTDRQRKKMPRTKKDTKMEKKIKKPKCSAEKSSKTKRLSKMAGEPKRPHTAFFLWNANREKIKQDNPGISVPELGKRAGQIWSEKKNKLKWIETAKKDKLRYNKEMETWAAKGSGNTYACSSEKKQEKEK